MYVENTVTINRPIEEVFEYASTPENDPTWVPASISNQRTLPGPMRVGMTTQETVKLFGRTSQDTWEVTEYDPPTVVAYRATSGPLSGAVVRVRCEPIEGGTRLMHAVEGEPRSLYYKAIAPLMRLALPRLLASMDRTLKNLLEGKPTRPSQSVEASVVVPLSPEETWDFLTGDQMRRAVELFSIAVAIENYQMRPDGTPRYTMVSKVGPFTMRGISDYFIYERPHRTANRILDNPLGGTFYVTFEPVPEGTRTSLRWEIEPQNPLVGILLPVLRPLLARQLQRDLDAFAKLASTPQGDQQLQEDQQHPGAASETNLLGGVVVALAILALYLLLRRRSRASRSRANRKRWRY